MDRSAVVERRSVLGCFPGQPIPGLYNRVVEVLRARHYIPRTEEASESRPHSLNIDTLGGPMHTWRLALVALAVVALTACDQTGGKHEIVRAGNQTYLLNKATGEAKLIEGSTLLPVRSPDPSGGNEPFKKAKNWPEQAINDLPGVKFKVRTKYRDGAMVWAIEAGPFPGELEQAYKGIRLGALTQPTVMFELYDEEGFKTGDAIEVKIRLGSRTVNEKNEVIELNWSGTQPMSADTYRSAAFLSTRWFGFKKE